MKNKHGKAETVKGKAEANKIALEEADRGKNDSIL